MTVLTTVSYIRVWYRTLLYCTVLHDAYVLYCTVLYDSRYCTLLLLYSVRSARTRTLSLQTDDVLYGT